MYNWLPSAERKELYKRAFHKDFLPPPMFNSIQVPKPNKRSPADKRGYQLQMHMKMLALQAAQAHQALLNGSIPSATLYLRDILLKVAEIGTQGTMTRIYAQNPQIASVINYSHSNKVLTPAILQEYKKLKPMYENAHGSVFNSNSNSGFLYGRAANMVYNNRMGRYKRYNTANTPPANSSFFLKGKGTSGQLSSNPFKVLPATFPRLEGGIPMQRKINVSNPEGSKLPDGMVAAREAVAAFVEKMAPYW
jgi:hypothetical protein